MLRCQHASKPLARTRQSGNSAQRVYLKNHLHMYGREEKREPQKYNKISSPAPTPFFFTGINAVEFVRKKSRKILVSRGLC
jgi:hypothetical protein